MRRRILFLSAALLALSRTFAQAEQPVRNLDLNAFYGSVLLHNTDISHLIRNHPSGIILGWNTKTFGSQAWQSLFNYPDTGISFVYQDMRNETLGQHFGLYAHYLSLIHI